MAAKVVHNVCTAYMGIRSDQISSDQIAYTSLQVHDEDGKPFEIELSWVCEESGGLHTKVPAEIVAEAERAAKAALADSDM